MTNREKAIVMAHTGICMLEGEKLGVFYQYLNELYGRPVYTHEWVTLDIKEKSKPDFLQLCKEEEPERRGRWIEEYSANHFQAKCSACGESTLYGITYDLEGNAYYMNYCPNCGARMEAKE